MNRAARLTTLAVLAAGAAAAQLEPGDPRRPAPLLRRVAVDCSAGQRLAPALLLPADELEISLTGICVETIEIERDHVALVGGDPQRDGLRAPEGGDPDEAVVSVRRARDVRLESLSIAGSAGDGLRVIDTREGVTLADCRIVGNARWGASLVDSEAVLRGCVVTGNGGGGRARLGGGLLVTRNSAALCDNCLIADNPRAGEQAGVMVYAASSLVLRDASVAGATAVVAQLHSTVSATDSDLAGADWAFEASHDSHVFVRGGEIHGPFLAVSRSAIELFGAVQTFNPGHNFVTEGSQLLADDRRTDTDESVATRLEGLTLVSDFSSGKLVDRTAAGELLCAVDGRVFCDGSETKVSSSGCGRCP